MDISVVLAGAPNDDDVLQSAVCFAAREACVLRVVLADSFPKDTFPRHLDAALLESTKRGLRPPRVTVEQRHACPHEELRTSSR